MEAYERRMAALRSGEYIPPAEDSYDPAQDMKAHQSKHKKVAVEQESYLSKEQLQALRKVQHERIEVRMILHLSLGCDLIDRLYFILAGWQDEVAGNGREDKYGRADGRHCV